MFLTADNASYCAPLWLRPVAPEFRVWLLIFNNALATFCFFVPGALILIAKRCGR
jgi:hypothetical protein